MQLSQTQTSTPISENLLCQTDPVSHLYCYQMLTWKTLSNQGWTEFWMSGFHFVSFFSVTEEPAGQLTVVSEGDFGNST